MINEKITVPRRTYLREPVPFHLQAQYLVPKKKLDVVGCHFKNLYICQNDFYMFADGIINTLHIRLSDIIVDGKYSDLPLRAYKFQLDSSFDGIVEAITNDINRDADWLTKEDNQYLKEGFRHLIPSVKEHIHTLTDRLQKIEKDSEGDARTQMQIDFCNRLQAFIETLPNKIDELNGDALTQEDMNRCFFDALTPNITPRHLVPIYYNLIDKGYISKKYTSMGDFMYYFTGEGFKPSEPIHWKLSTVKLTIFLKLIVVDEKIWAKASHIFLVKDKFVGKKVLGNTYSTAMDRDKGTVHLNRIKSQITNVTVAELEPWKAI